MCLAALDAFAMPNCLNLYVTARGTATGAAVRVLDAGTGWGGTVFFAEAARAAAARDAEAARAADAARAAAAGTDDAEAARTANAATFATLDLPLVRYDGLTLSPTQARQANADAARKGLGATARFHVRSFDAVLPSPDPYAVVYAIESLEHSPDLDATLPKNALEQTRSQTVRQRGCHLGRGRRRRAGRLRGGFGRPQPEAPAAAGGGGGPWRCGHEPARP